MKHFKTIPVLLLFSLLLFRASGQEPSDRELPVMSGFYDMDLLPPEFHKERREALRAFMPENSLAVIFTYPRKRMSNDVFYEYHPNPDFYYLSGIREPNGVLFICSDSLLVNGEYYREIAFCQERNPENETWDGKRLGVEMVEKKMQIEKAFTGLQFPELEIAFEKLENIFYLLPTGMEDDAWNRGDVASLVKHFKLRTQDLSGDRGGNHLKYWMAKLRELKHQQELELMRKAIYITCKAQMEVMRVLEPGMKEYQAEAILEFWFHNNGAEQVGFPSIIGGGENSCVLHYQSNRKLLGEDDLLVMDVGAEYHGYTADVTRTLPVSGKFNSEQKKIYEIVLKAQKAGIEECQVGNKFWDPHNEATDIITRELRKLGIIKKRSEVKRYFMHGTSHYLGLDVHDAGLYGMLEAGNVITVEPGIYIPEGSPCDPKWWNIGIRIEDDILITSDGPENLSKLAPREIKEIEKLMQEESIFETLR